MIASFLGGTQGISFGLGLRSVSCGTASLSRILFLPPSFTAICFLIQSRCEATRVTMPGLPLPAHPEPRLMTPTMVETRAGLGSSTQRGPPLSPWHVSCVTGYRKGSMIFLYVRSNSWLLQYTLNP